MDNPFNPVALAAYRTVRDFRRGGRRGAQALAPMLGKAPGTLSNEVNPDVTTHKLGVEDAVAVMLAAGDFQLADAIEAELGRVATPMPDFADVSDMELLDAWADWHRDTGETAGAIKAALADGRIDRQELDAIKKEVFEDFQRELALLQRLEALCDE
jgi:hypothetical protein